MLIKLLWVFILVHIVLTWLQAIRRGFHARRLKDTIISTPADFQPPVSIIVPAWNEKGRIEQCIRSLKEITYPTWEAIILAGGQDGTYEATLKASDVDNRFKVLERGPEPKNVALTRGIEEARHNILVLLDADSIVASDWLSILVETLAEGASASYGFYLPMKWTWISTEEYMMQIQYHIKEVAIFPGCASVAIRRQALEKIGSLTAEAYSWEDWDVYARLINAKERIIPASRARLRTDRPTTLREFWANYLRAFRTHWAGLWYHRAIFIRRPFWAFYELFFLVYGATLTFAMIAGLATIVIQPELIPIVTRWALLLAVWIFARRAALAGEVSAYTGESKWLAWFWVPVVLLFIRILGTFIAILTVWRQPHFDYKGSRALQIEQSTIE